MKIELLVIGKTTDKHLNQLIETFENRLKHYISFEIRTIPELRDTKNMPVSEQKEKEADKILKGIEPGDEIILLDEGGKMFSSTEFAAYFSAKMHVSIKRMIFVTGGPYGFSSRVYNRANQCISLSRMTFSHQMVRLIFTEQLYRAMTIIRGEKYHND